MNKRAKSILAYSLLFTIIFAGIVLLANVVIAYTSGSSDTSINYNLITEDIAGRHYTPQCLGTCDLVFTLSYSGDLAPSSVAIDTSRLRPQFNWVKGQDKFTGSEIYYLHEYQEEVDDYSTLCLPYDETDPVNGTITEYPNCTQVLTGSHLENRQEWQELSTLNLEKGKTYYLNIRGYFKPSLDGFKVDVIPLVNIAGTDFGLTEMAVWYGSYDYRRKENVNQTTASYIINFIYPINGSGGFNVGGGQVIAWTSIDVLPNNTFNGTQYLYYSSNGSAVEVNGTSDQQRPVDCEPTTSTCTSYNPTNVWANYYFVGHNITKDSSASNLLVTLNDGIGGVQTEVTGYIGKALNFTSTDTTDNNNVTIHNAPNMSNWTVMFWYRTPVPSTAQTILHDADYYIEMGSTYSGRVRIGHPSGGPDIDCTGVMVANQWYFFVFQNAQLGPKMIYMNGTLCASATDNVNQSFNGDLLMNERGPYTNQPIFGDIDELRIYPNSFSADEIKAMYEMMRLNYSSLGAEHSMEAASESEGNDAIEQGIMNSVINTTNKTYYSTQLYTVDLNNTYSSGKFDVIVASGNQRWAFNYITDDDPVSSGTGMSNMIPVLYVWEASGITYAQITSAVENFIDSTKRNDV